MAASLSGTRTSKEEQPLAISGAPRSYAPPGAAAPANVLIIDDDEDSLHALQAVLEPLQQRLVIAHSGEEGLRQLLREEFAVILLDMRMPGLDGVETARYIHARARTRHIPIVFLTAQEEDVQQVFHAYAAGAVDYVVKPFDPDVLRSKVAVFVELHRARAEHVLETRARAEAEAIASTVGKLQSVSDAALAHLEMEELLPELLRRAAAVFNADAAGLLLAEEERAASRLILCEQGECSERAFSRAEAEQAFGPALAGSTLGLGEVEQEHPLRGLISGELRSLIAAPLSLGRRPQGALFLGSSSSGHFGEEDLVVLGLGAERAAIAIEHARSYERERELVEALQHHFLPERLPEVPGLEMAARYRPSEQMAQVGGDWYDAIPLPDGRLGVAIGDVVGHGIGAATLMGELRASLRAYAVAGSPSPARALAALNSLAAATHGGMVATLLYMVVDVDGEGIRFASSGHPPPVLLAQDGSAQILEQTTASPLGTAEPSEFEDCEARLPAGATIMLYTDGLVERRGEALDAGLERLSRELRDGSGEDIERLCTHVLAHVPAAGGAQDDIALLAVRRLPPDRRRLELELAAEPGSLSVARHRLESWLGELGAREDDIFSIRLAANEACTNAVEHAYGPERGPSFRLLAEHADRVVCIEVLDRGRWRAPRGTHRGLGLKMIGQVMDELDLQQGAEGTTVRMRKALSQP